MIQLKPLRPARDNMANLIIRALGTSEMTAAQIMAATGYTDISLICGALNNMCVQNRVERCATTRDSRGALVTVWRARRADRKAIGRAV